MKEIIKAVNEAEKTCNKTYRAFVEAGDAHKKAIKARNEAYKTRQEASGGGA